MIAAGVIHKEIGAQWIVSIRETIAAYREIGGLFGKLYGLLPKAAREGTGIALYHRQGAHRTVADSGFAVDIGGGSGTGARSVPHFKGSAA